MSLFELIFIAIGLSMDAFAVSACKGLSVRTLQKKHMLICGIYFGGFQALMPLAGYFLGVSFAQYIEAFDHWIAFALLLIIGINMIIEANKKEEEKMDCGFGYKNMLLLAVATSIDALIIGVTFAFLRANIWMSVTLIGSITFVLSMLGVKIGNIFGSKFKSKAELAGGVILIAIGTKILIDHLFF